MPLLYVCFPWKLSFACCWFCLRHTILHPNLLKLYSFNNYCCLSCCLLPPNILLAFIEGLVQFSCLFCLYFPPYQCIVAGLPYFDEFYCNVYFFCIDLRLTCCLTFHCGCFFVVAANLHIFVGILPSGFFRS